MCTIGQAEASFPTCSKAPQMLLRFRGPLSAARYSVQEEGSEDDRKPTKENRSNSLTGVGKETSVGAVSQI